jgi:hypothetical protein
MRPGFPTEPVGDLLGSTLEVRETDSCRTICASVGSLVFEHDWSTSSGTRDGGWRTLATLAGTPGTGTDRGGTCETGEWRTEEERKVETDGGGVLGSGGACDSNGGGATEWLSWVYACAVCGPLPDNGKMVHSTPVPDVKA